MGHSVVERGRSSSKEPGLLRDQSPPPGLGGCDLSGEVFPFPGCRASATLCWEEPRGSPRPFPGSADGSMTELGLDMPLPLWAGTGTHSSAHAWHPFLWGAFSPEVDGERQLVRLLTATGG